MKWNRNSKIFVHYFLGPLLFCWLTWSIYRQISKQPDLEQAWFGIRASLGSSKIWYLVAVVLLMVVNWAIEARKWQLAVKPVQQIPFLKSFKAVLSGVSFSISMPNRVGEYFGRVLYMDEGNRLKTISLTIVTSISQLIITLIMGCAGLIFMRGPVQDAKLIAPMWMDVILYGVIAVLVVMLLFYFRLSWLVKLLGRIPGSKKYLYLVEALGQFDYSLLLRLLSLSFIRFCVFLLQYYLLFSLFGVHLALAPLTWGLSVSFLILAIIPSLAILELVQRGEILTRIFSLYSANTLGIGFTSAGIWFINLVVPAIIGSLLILGIRKFNQRSNP
ncbi:MAG: flippase-like domain-containing protein [Chitinophagaceae bacterium]|nr:flippase-like domain-containing protein [Chitinophagaceae bacterium]